MNHENDAQGGVIVGRNPVREAIRSGADIEYLLIAKGELSRDARELITLARERRIVVKEADRKKLDEVAPGHQGFCAYLSAARYASVREILDVAAERGEPLLIVILDGITDPHNLGAVIRSAECFGAHGVILPERRSAGLTPTAVKAACGATAHIKVARVTNLNACIDALKDAGVWVYAAEMGGQPYYKSDLTGSAAIVVGAEGEGISRLTKEKCDFTLSIPLKGKVESLNASVAAGVLLAEVSRQRG